MGDSDRRVRAAVMKAPGVMEVETFPRPDVEPGAVLMQVLYSGICGTDKHTFRGETIQYAGTPHERRLEYPLICGHENVGVVVETGGDGGAADGMPPPHSLRPGDSVAVIGIGPLGLCHVIKARFLECGELIAIDLLASRLRNAEAFGVSHTIDASQLDQDARVEAVRAATDGRGADV